MKFAKAEEPQDREKAKGSLKNAIIGFVLIFVLILALNLLMPNMVNWVNSQNGTDIISQTQIDNMDNKVTQSTNKGT